MKTHFKYLSVYKNINQFSILNNQMYLYLFVEQLIIINYILYITMIKYQHMINTTNHYGIFSIDFTELNKNVYVHKCLNIYIYNIIIAHKE